jgi:NADH-quinone oxidoreductase subunit E
MVQIGKDYYEDLTAESFAGLLNAFARGEVPRPGPQNGRWASEPGTGRTSLPGDPAHGGNASVELALARADTVARIRGELESGDMRPSAGRAATETGLAEIAGEPAGSVAPDAAPHTTPDRKEQAEKPAPLRTPEAETAGEAAKQEAAERQSFEAPAHGNNGSGLPPAGGLAERRDEVMPDPGGHPPEARPSEVAGRLSAPREGRPDDLKRIRGVGPKLEALLNRLGVYHFDQIAGWNAEQVAMVDEHLGDFRGRILRDDWVSQAGYLAKGGEPGAAKGSLRSSEDGGDQG